MKLADDETKSALDLTGDPVELASLVMPRDGFVRFGFILSDLNDDDEEAVNFRILRVTDGDAVRRDVRFAINKRDAQVADETLEIYADEGDTVSLEAWSDDAADGDVSSRVELLAYPIEHLPGIKSATDLITEDLQVTVSQVVQAGDLIEMFQGEARLEDLGNALVVRIDPGDVDLTGREGRFSMVKQVDSDGTETFTKSADVLDAGGEDQRIVVEIAKAESEQFAVDDTQQGVFALPIGRAYRYRIGYADPGTACAVALKGEVSVQPLDLDCTGS